MTNAVAIAQQGSNNTTFRNKIINGAMAVDQRNQGNSLTVTTSTTYGLDRWQNAVNVSSKFSVQRVADAPAGFTYSMKATSLSSYSIGVSEVSGFRQYIEGYNTADLAQGTSGAKSFTLSFWVKSSLTGTFGGIVGNDSDRTWAFTYTISAANTWEYKTVSVTGQTSGTWGVTNDVGMAVLFSLACGTNYLATPSQWSNGNYYGATGQTSVLATNATTWQITGVQLEQGSAASPFETRLYTTELQLCQRYYTQSIPTAAASGLYSSGLCYYNVGWNYSGGSWVGGTATFPVTMRTTPSVTLYTSNQSSTSTANRVSYFQGSWTNVGAQVSGLTNINCLSFENNGAGGSTGSNLIQFNFIASSEF